jgi:hypothetical protein
VLNNKPSGFVSAVGSAAFATLVTVMVLAAGCLPLPAPYSLSPLAPTSAAGPGPSLTIVHSNDTWGYLTPCG